VRCGRQTADSSTALTCSVGSSTYVCFCVTCFSGMGLVEISFQMFPAEKAAVSV